MIRFGKRAQAALEFLMTYSWAILVVIIIIGALAYFGVLNPSSLVPEKCTMTAGMACNDYGVQIASSGNTATFRLMLVNSEGYSIDIQSVNITGTSLTGGGSGCGLLGSAAAAVGNNITDSQGKVLKQTSEGYTATNGDTFTVAITNADCVPLAPNQKTRATIDLYYVNTGSTIPHHISGEVFVKPTQS